MTMTPKDFRSLIESRQSIRFFEQSRIIPIQLIEEIIDDAQQAPNDCNHQSWKFVVITDQALKEKLVNTAGSCEPARRAPVLVVPIIQMGWNHNKFSIIQTLAAATHTLVLSARSRGIAGVWMAGIGNVETIRKLLGIPPFYIIDCLVGLGYAEDSHLPWPKAPRQDAGKIYSLNHFDFDPDTIYPLKKTDRYNFWEIRNQDNPYALWHPKNWTLKQIAFFRGNAVWDGSPSPLLHKSRRLANELRMEIELARVNLSHGKTLLFFPFSGAYSAALLKAAPSLDLTHFELAPGHESIIKKRLAEEGLQKNIPFFADNRLKVPLPDGFFSNILIFQGLEILPEPDLLIKEAERLLKPGGRLIITCRNRWSWLFAQFKFSTSRASVWNFGPYWPFSPLSLRRLLNRAFDGKFLGISPLPNKIGVLVKKWPFNYFCRLLVFIGEKANG